MPKQKKNTHDSTLSHIGNMLSYANNHILSINDSKIFAGIMIVIINIASKFVTFKLSKSVESYLKFTFSRDILVFAITWMGTRDIYISLGMTLLFVVVIDYLLNENSSVCCLPQTFINKHIDMLEGMTDNAPSDEEVKKAKQVLEQAGVAADLEDANARPAYKKIDDATINLQGY